MIDFFTYFLLFVAVVLVLLIFRYLYLNNLKRSRESYVSSRLKTQKTETGGIDFVRCSMCNTPLAQGEDMVSRIFRPMKTGEDQRMNVMGCTHCYPKCQNGATRVCPVCRGDVPMDGYLIARLFNRSGTKKHVMITGCTRCYGPKKNKT